jgi:predicted lipid-binding transport protein (Tim44 family)
MQVYKGPGCGTFVLFIIGGLFFATSQTIDLLKNLVKLGFAIFVFFGQAFYQNAFSEYRQPKKEQHESVTQHQSDKNGEVSMDNNQKEP